MTVSLDCFEAAKQGQIETIDTHLNNRVDVNQSDANHLTMVHHAAQNNQIKAIKFLKTQGAKLWKKDADGCNALHYAAKNGNLELFNYLLTCGVRITATDNQGKTPIHYAAEAGHNNILLACQKYDLEPLDNKGNTPLYYAIEKHKEACALFLADKSTWTHLVKCFYSAAVTGQLSIMNRVGDRLGWKNVASVNLYKQVIRANHIPVLTKLLEKAFPDLYTRNQILCFAVMNGQAESALALLKHSFSDSCPVLHLAAKSGQVEKVRKFITVAKLDVNRKEHFHSIYVDNSDMSNLGEYQIDSEDATPLFCAVRNNHNNVVACLLEHKADPNIANYEDKTPLFIAASMGNKDIVRMLLDAGANKEYRGHSAASYAKDPQCKEMLDRHIVSMNDVANFIYQKPVSQTAINLLEYRDLAEWKVKIGGTESRGQMIYELINTQHINRNNEVMPLLASLGKKDVLMFIENASLDLKKQLVTEALKPGTQLNRFFWIQRGILAPSLNSGSLGHLTRLHAELLPDSTVTFAQNKSVVEQGLTFFARCLTCFDKVESPVEDTKQARI